MLNRKVRLKDLCSLQINSEAPEQRKTRRLNGLQLPLHPQQVAGWIVLLILIISTFILILPNVGYHLYGPINFLFICIIIIHIISHLCALIIDPAVKLVRAKPSNIVIPEFDRTKHLHVIENGRCHLCNITINNYKKIKHCSICNKCIKLFDHHCMWLNNCIGKRNYLPFLICIISAVIGTLGITIIVIGQLTTTFFNNSTDINMENTTLPLLPIQGTSSLVFLTIIGIISAIAAAFLIHLCIFHGYIACLGLTTYEYVKNKREKINKINNNTNEQTIHNDPRPFCIEPVRYHFCKTINNNIDDNAIENESNQVYICSTHTSTTQSSLTSNNININNNDKRNFHLYFSYNSQDDATSIELSSSTTSQNILDNLQSNMNLTSQQLELKPSTPSPVSCCFSMINHHNWTEKSKKKSSTPSSSSTTGVAATRGSDNNSTTNDEKSNITNRCTTVKRIQTFLRTRLRKNSRHKALDSSKSRKNRISPVTTPQFVRKSIEVEPSIQQIDDDIILPVQNNSQQLYHLHQQQRPPIKLPPLNLPSRHSTTFLKNTDELSDNIYTIPTIIKRQQHLRIRRPSLHRRPRFKINPHITQSAQLSPIPESELSKPASPKVDQHFSFPSANE